MAIIEKSLVAFILVYLTSLFWPVMPSALTVFGVLLTVVLLTLLSNKTKQKCKAFLFGAGAGFIWACSVGHWYSFWQLPNSFINQNIVIEGVVDSIHIQQKWREQVNESNNTQVYDSTLVTSHILKSQSLIVLISKLGKKSLSTPIKVILNWYSPEFELYQGNKVRLLVTLLPPHGLLNIDGNNQQKYLASQNIVSIGKIRTSPSNQILDSSISLRQKLLNQIQEYKPNNLKWLIALALGERSLLDSADWRMLQESGTAHLFAISGMHLGIVSAFMFIICKCILSLALGFFPQNLPYKQLNLLKWSLLCTIPLCYLYALLSGFQIPVIRALIAYTILVLLSSFELHWRIFSSLLLLSFLFIVLFPLSLLSLSFWFSYLAVIAILYWVWRWQISAPTFTAKLKQLIYLQFYLSVFMLPIVASQFGTISLVSPLINMLLLPIVSVVLVPLGLLVVFATATYMHDLAILSMTSFSFVFDYLLLLFNTFLNTEISAFNSPVFNHALVTSLTIAGLYLLLPAWPNKRLFLFISVVMSFNYIVDASYGYFPITQGLSKVFNINMKEDNERWHIDIVDIGQGLSVIIAKNEQLIIYDTGPRYASSPAVASRVLPQYIEQTSKGEFDVDMLINSHYDSDHAGGNEFITSHFNVRALFGPDNGCNTAQSRQLGEQWNGLSIRVLWPLSQKEGKVNDESCVIRIDHKEHSWLLTGDIEQEAERALIKHYESANLLNVDFLLIAHHGSKTSSTAGFLKEVKPKHAFISSKYYNHWGFPHSRVVENLNAVGARIYNTADDGAIRVEFDSEGYNIDTMRSATASPWYQKLRKR
ncbi:DNA internalization-related competence protein ComEC/Rec2 [Glaciecola sp. MH2013]|uniref:DNA internalization-related competence protein ComEC/Rec2 n=1 Tax=Glaciecola sp. MH2013 TaxID=2785524 RepID=UPI00189E591A|nr:DNA internalization-related competence protein ComEC/Rec2 [Glaciecola sp. MH2013]MBF7072655.1 DNA internalization-related competence protein ComEC/Rec2 [Glaciecola sp. MH2013]